MSMLDLMAKTNAKQAVRVREMDLALDDRLKAAGLPPKSKGDFLQGLPVSLQGWDTYESLLEREGNLTPEERENILRGRESIRIRERRKQLEIRIKNGENLPDPEYEGGDPVSPKYAFLGQGALITWQAIRELGLSDDPYYQHKREAARNAMGDVLRRRGDFRKILESYSHAPISVPPRSALPDGFIETEVSIPKAAFSQPLSHTVVVRYHTEFGLLHGHVIKQGYYDRGAGSYPGSRGARVVEFRVGVSLLLELVDFRKCRGIAKRSVWRTFGDPPVIVGREKSTNAIEDRLFCLRAFDSFEAASDFLNGKTESEFANVTLPVEVSSTGSSYRFKFLARPV